MRADIVKAFLLCCAKEGLPVPEEEKLFALEYGRKWRTDYFFEWEGVRLAVEAEGIFFNAGQGKSRHQTGTGYIGDMLKYNVYAMEGIKLLRFSAFQLEKNMTLCCRVIKQVLGIAKMNEEDMALFIAMDKKNKKEVISPQQQVSPTQKVLKYLKGLKYNGVLVGRKIVFSTKNMGSEALTDKQKAHIRKLLGDRFREFYYHSDSFEIHLTS